MRTVAALLIGSLLIASAGCERSASEERPPVATAAPIVNASPYMCDVIPEQAFRYVTGLTASLDDQWVNGPQPDNGLCLAFGAGREAPIGVQWSYNNGKNVLARQRKAWKGDFVHPLPVALGEGLAVIRPTFGADSRPNYVIALFRCGKKKPWISIDFVPVVRGRDAVRDMFDFMRIAEKRFGEIHKCTPRPA